MIPKGKYIELLSPSNEVILRFRVIESEDDSQNGNGSSNGSRKEKKKFHPSVSNEELITEPQKKYLFRILAEQGIEGNEAYDKLKDIFGVDTLQAVTKLEASREIDHMLKQTKGGNGNGSSVE